MTCAEAVMGADAGDTAAYKALVDEKMMVIFEACSFQDITGQRIAQVVETLQHIEQRVARFAEVLKASDFTGFMTDEERARADVLRPGPAPVVRVQPRRSAARGAGRRARRDADGRAAAGCRRRRRT